MRTREEIEKSNISIYNEQRGYFVEPIFLEVLLDIRDILYREDTRPKCAGCGELATCLFGGEDYCEEHYNVMKGNNV